ncbi:hypothetical protein KAR91_23980 [Candidatus Pacearchaeota archaeon]|nr:hypothetical protein [Candidatus Pacearchaeota archaeon]
MLKERIQVIIQRIGLWYSIHLALAACIVVMLCFATVGLLFPVSVVSPDIFAGRYSNTTLQHEPTATKPANEFSEVFRSGFFKADAGPKDRPMADKTIERIRSQLKLRCIMELNGQPVAYINIQGIGLKRCSVGESVNDLFTVLDINKQSKSVAISIVKHKVILYL